MSRLLLTYALYTLAFICWAPVVHLQIRIRIWFALGWPAFIALTGIFWLMVNRPDLWG